MKNLQRNRLVTRTAFFFLFLLAPVLDIFRFDLTETHFIILGQALSLDITKSWVLTSTPLDTGLRILFRFVLPLIAIIATGIFIFWKWGRIYCGWLCPHFSVVETINDLMHSRTGKVTLWEKATPGSEDKGGFFDWFVIVLVSVVIAFSWALGLLSYLLPPIPLYTDLVYFELSRGETVFLCVATLAFTIDFVFARHLFCKYGCAVGVFQSLFWMMNPKSMVVEFDRERASLCKDCDKDCEEACPMRLPVRSFKRSKFTCTQCAQCISACVEVQKDNADGSLLAWDEGEKTKQTSLIPMVSIETPKSKK